MKDRKVSNKIASRVLVAVGWLFILVLIVILVLGVLNSRGVWYPY